MMVKVINAIARWMTGNLTVIICFQFATQKLIVLIRFCQGFPLGEEEISLVNLKSNVQRVCEMTKQLNLLEEATEAKQVEI